MKLPAKLNLLALFITLIVTAPAYICFAQENIKLKDVQKFELSIHGEAFAGDLKEFEIIYENELWKCYQTRLHITFDNKTKAEVSDSSRSFIKFVPEKILSRLISLIASKDTEMHVAAFGIEGFDLVNSVDSLNLSTDPTNYDLSPEKREQFIYALRSENNINTAFYNLLHHKKMDDESLYVIKITTKAGNAIIARAFNFAYPYYLPWHVDDRTTYNPNISLLFNDIINNNDFAKKEQLLFIRQIDREIFRQNFNKGN